MFLFYSLLDALTDTLKMIPLLLVVFLVLEYFEQKNQDFLNSKLKITRSLGPIIGALLGLIPQCGISVLAVGFFSKKMISIGTLMSIFIATSDEAIPILFAKPSSVGVVLPLMVTKLVLAIIVGYIIDLLFHKSSYFEIEPLNSFETSCTCDHHNNTDSKIDGYKILYGTLKRTFTISLYIFFITSIFNIIFELKGLNSIVELSNSNIYLQILFISLVGLIPNCATSVALVEVYLRNGIIFSSLIAGLSANAGLGLLVLYKDKLNRKKALRLTLLLYASAVLCGLITYVSFNFWELI